MFAAGGLPVSMVTLTGSSKGLLWLCFWHEAGTVQRAGVLKDSKRDDTMDLLIFICQNKSVFFVSVVVYILLGSFAVLIEVKWILCANS